MGELAIGLSCATLQIYPSREDSRGVSIYARGGAANPVSGVACQMRWTWPDVKAVEGKEPDRPYTRPFAATSVAQAG